MGSQDVAEDIALIDVSKRRPYKLMNASSRQADVARRNQYMVEAFEGRSVSDFLITQPFQTQPPPRRLSSRICRELIVTPILTLLPVAP